MIHNPWLYLQKQTSSLYALVDEPTIHYIFYFADYIKARIIINKLDTASFDKATAQSRKSMTSDLATHLYWNDTINKGALHRLKRIIASWCKVRAVEQVHSNFPSMFPPFLPAS